MPFNAPKTFQEALGKNPSQWDLANASLSVMPIPMGEFEVKAYPATNRALSQIIGASKRAIPDTGTDRFLQTLYQYFKNYKEALEYMTWPEKPTAEELAKIKVTPFRDVLKSEQSGVKGAESGYGRLHFPPFDVETKLRSLEETLKEVYKK